MAASHPYDPPIEPSTTPGIHASLVDAGTAVSIRTGTSRMRALLSDRVTLPSQVPIPRCQRWDRVALCPDGARACPTGSFGCHPGWTTDGSFHDLVGQLGDLAGTPRPRPRELVGRKLRYWLTITLVDAQDVVTVASLGERLEASGLAVAGRTSKVISDSLRWEVRRGRVQRVGRGRYVACRFPRQTLAWMRTRLEHELDKDPLPVRQWPVGGWRVGWSSVARGRELAAARTERAASCRKRQYAQFVARHRATAAPPP